METVRDDRARASNSARCCFPFFSEVRFQRKHCLKFSKGLAKVALNTTQKGQSVFSGLR